ncbi:hypothetical protein HK102_000485 [Quaeritorhiza haematococci]|nr:hypothetical protein HK102_000485 [Quaeritorhiza haematococci]
MARYVKDTPRFHGQFANLREVLDLFHDIEALATFRASRGSQNQSNSDPQPIASMKFRHIGRVFVPDFDTLRHPAGGGSGGKSSKQGIGATLHFHHLNLDRYRHVWRKLCDRANSNSKTESLVGKKNKAKWFAMLVHEIGSAFSHKVTLWQLAYVFRFATNADAWRSTHSGATDDDGPMLEYCYWDKADVEAFWKKPTNINKLESDFELLRSHLKEYHPNCCRVEGENVNISKGVWNEVVFKKCFELANSSSTSTLGSTSSYALGIPHSNSGSAVASGVRSESTRSSSWMASKSPHTVYSSKNAPYHERASSPHYGRFRSAEVPSSDMHRNHTPLPYVNKRREIVRPDPQDSRRSSIYHQLPPSPYVNGKREIARPEPQDSRRSSIDQQLPSRYYGNPHDNRVHDPKYDQSQLRGPPVYSKGKYAPAELPAEPVDPSQRINNAPHSYSKRERSEDCDDPTNKRRRVQESSHNFEDTKSVSSVSQTAGSRSRSSTAEGRLPAFSSSFSTSSSSSDAMRTLVKPHAESQLQETRRYLEQMQGDALSVIMELKDAVLELLYYSNRSECHAFAVKVLGRDRPTGSKDVEKKIQNVKYPGVIMTQMKLNNAHGQYYHCGPVCKPFNFGEVLNIFRETGILIWFERLRRLRESSTNETLSGRVPENLEKFFSLRDFGCVFVPRFSPQLLRLGDGLVQIRGSKAFCLTTSFFHRANLNRYRSVEEQYFGTDAPCSEKERTRWKYMMVHEIHDALEDSPTRPSVDLGMIAFWRGYLKGSQVWSDKSTTANEYAPLLDYSFWDRQDAYPFWNEPRNQHKLAAAARDLRLHIEAFHGGCCKLRNAGWILEYGGESKWSDEVFEKGWGIYSAGTAVRAESTRDKWKSERHTTELMEIVDAKVTNSRSKAVERVAESKGSRPSANDVEMHEARLSMRSVAEEQVVKSEKARSFAGDAEMQEARLASRSDERIAKSDASSRPTNSEEEVVHLQNDEVARSAGQMYTPSMITEEHRPLAKPPSETSSPQASAREFVSNEPPTNPQMMEIDQRTPTPTKGQSSVLEVSSLFSNILKTNQHLVDSRSSSPAPSTPILPPASPKADLINGSRSSSQSSPSESRRSSDKSRDDKPSTGILQDKKENLVLGEAGQSSARSTIWSSTSGSAHLSLGEADRSSARSTMSPSKTGLSEQASHAAEEYKKFVGERIGRLEPVIMRILLESSGMFMSKFHMLEHFQQDIIPGIGNPPDHFKRIQARKALRGNEVPWDAILDYFVDKATTCTCGDPIYCCNYLRKVEVPFIQPRFTEHENAPVKLPYDPPADVKKIDEYLYHVAKIRDLVKCTRIYQRSEQERSENRRFKPLSLDHERAREFLVHHMFPSRPSVPVMNIAVFAYLETVAWAEAKRWVWNHRQDGAGKNADRTWTLHLLENHEELSFAQRAISSAGLEVDGKRPFIAHNGTWEMLHRLHRPWIPLLLQHAAPTMTCCTVSSGRMKLGPELRHSELDCGFKCYLLRRPHYPATDSERPMYYYAGTVIPYKKEEDGGSSATPVRKEEDERSSGPTLMRESDSSKETTHDKSGLPQESRDVMEEMMDVIFGCCDRVAPRCDSLSSFPPASASRPASPFHLIHSISSVPHQVLHFSKF